MNANTNIDLDEIHDSIVDSLSTQFPDLETVEAYREDRKRLPLPACLVELVDMDPSPDDDPGTEQLAVHAKFEAQIIVGFRVQNAKKAIRKLIGSLAVFIHQNRFGQPIGAAEVLSISPDNFSPELDQYEIWRVEWQHLIHLGETVWTNDGTVPTMILASWSPDIGFGHEDDYVQVAGTEVEE